MTNLVSRLIRDYRRSLDLGGSIVVANHKTISSQVRSRCEAESLGSVHYHGFRDDAIFGVGSGEKRRLIISTSGLTGAPKYVGYDLSLALEHARAISNTLNLCESSRYYAFCPPGYAYGLSVINSHHVADVPVQFRNSAEHDDLRDLAARSADNDVYYLLPSQLADLVLSGARSAAQPTLIIAGGYTPRRIVELLRDRFPNAYLINMYGKAEVGPRLSLWRGLLSDFESGLVGHPLPGVEFQLEDGKDSHELRVQSPWVADWILEFPYEGCRRPTRDSEGWLPTGDLFAREVNGWRFLRRADRTANVGGVLLDLDDIRASLEADLQVIHVAVGTRPSRVTGDAVLAIHATTESPELLSVADVKQALHRNVGAHATLAFVTISQSISRNEAAK